jgi:hypothetical protein
MRTTENLPVLAGVVDRRLLINYSVDPDVVAGILPRPFRPQLVRGRAVAGICLIRLRNMRPAGLPSWVGLQLLTDVRSVEPALITDVYSSFFADTRTFPSGSAMFDNALLMRRIPVRWKALPPLHTSQISDPDVQVA